MCIKPSTFSESTFFQKKTRHYRNDNKVVINQPFQDTIEILIL